ncbi:MAG: glycosyltransferase [Chitinivibrionia bacterium]|nr:glycosyltransferase [Chitinivibrionia bacterium]
MAKIAVHCEYARELLHAGARIAVIEHGSYRGVYPVNVTRDEARNALGLEGHATVFLFFGMIRRYKGLEMLCESFQSVADENSMLLIAGKPYEDEDQSMVAELRRRFASARLRFVPEFIPDEHVARYFLASDYCVFPFERVLTSGSVVLSLGFGCPILAPRTGCLAELEEHNVGFFFEPGDRASLEEALRSAIACDRRRALSDNAREYAASLSWKRIARRYEALYSE